MITMAVTGLNCGSIKNAIRPTTAIAAITAIKSTSLACGFRSSKIMQNGIIASPIIHKAMKDALLSFRKKIPKKIKHGIANKIKKMETLVRFPIFLSSRTLLCIYMIASYSNCVSKSFPTAAIITKARINCAYGNAVS